ncbi:MAG TPA: hypothetical protein VE270_04365, partial [Thermoleophilaceae bacterium]|nr:hypothetical protein [Thermoleophilaceae bacterium]
MTSGIGCKARIGRIDPLALGHASEAAPRRPRRCRPTESNRGGDNNYIPDAPELGSLGHGFV